MNISEFRQFAARLEAMYKSPFSGKDEKNAWYREMRDISAADANEALTRWVRSSRYVPTLAELLNLALPMHPAEPEARENEGGIAWMKPYIEAEDKRLLAKWGTWEAYREHLREIGVPDPVSGLE